MDNNKRNKKRNNSNGLAIGTGIGISTGIAIGIATNNIGLWLPTGLYLGLSIVGYKQRI